MVWLRFHRLFRNTISSWDSFGDRNAEGPHYVTFNGTSKKAGIKCMILEKFWMMKQYPTLLLSIYSQSIYWFANYDLDIATDYIPYLALLDRTYRSKRRNSRRSIHYFDEVRGEVAIDQYGLLENIFSDYDFPDLFAQ